LTAAVRRGSAAGILAAAGLFLGGCERGPAVRKAADRPAAQREAMDRLPGPGFEPPPPASYQLASIQRAADGNVLDADGTRHRLSSYLGDRLVLLSFIYTRCTDGQGCPFATAVFHLIEREIASRPGLEGRVRLVTLSFDPSHDTPEVMLRYAGDGYLDQPWHERRWAFLTTGSSRDLQPILDGYGQSVAPEIDENGDLTDRYSHVLKVFLIDRERRVRNIYSTGFLHPAVVVNDLETLRMEETRAGGAS
jgi:cytochrome oxidase Cu insertion factor (SCO1/SenC/PrrC family)